MQLKEGSGFTTINPFLASSALAAMFAATFTLATSAVLRHYQAKLDTNKEIAVSMQDLGWWTHLNVGVDHPNFLPPSVAVTPKVQLMAKVIAPSPKVKVTPHNHKVSHRIVQTVRIVPVNQVVPQMTPQIVFPVVTKSESQTLQDIRSHLRGQFLAAMDTHPKVNTQMVAAAPANATSTSPLVDQAQSEEPRIVREVTPEEVTKVRSQQQANLESEKVLQSLQAESPEKQPKIPSTKQFAFAFQDGGSKDRRSSVVLETSNGAKIQVSVPQLRSMKEDSALAKKDDTQENLQNTPRSQVKITIKPDKDGSAIVAQPTKQPEYSTPQSSISENTPQEPPLFQFHGKPLSSGLTTQFYGPQVPKVEYSSDRWDHPDTQPKLANNTQKNTSGISALTNGNVDTQDPTKTSPTKTLKDTLLAARNARHQFGKLISTAIPLNKLEGIEAFDWKLGFAVNSQSLADEGPSDEVQPTWVLSNASNHWPTVRWNSALNPDSHVPLISQNTALTLALAAGTQLQTGAALVFGKVPAGWTVNLTGRDRDLNRVYFDAEMNVLVPDSAYENIRYFAFVNAVPGAQLIHLTKPTGESWAATAIPVMPGVATYIDLTHFQIQKIEGQVTDDLIDLPAPLAKVLVRVWPQPKKTSTTDVQGHFSIPDVVTFDDLPILLESWAPESHVHRYSIKPLHFQSAHLVRFDKDQVNDWVSHLSGGISPESGVIVSDLSDFIEDQPLFPSAESLMVDADLTPETFVLRDDQPLARHSALNEETGRFISVEIPKGLNLVKLEDKAQKKVWSQLIMASPGVVNVVAP